MNLLADVAQTDPMISGNWLIGIIGALTTGAAAIIGKLMGRKEGETSREVTLKKPVPTVVTREEPQWASRPDLEAHEERTANELKQVWEAIDGERKIAREALGRIHTRLDNQSTATATLQGTVNAVNSNVNKLLDLALKKPGTRQ